MIQVYINSDLEPLYLQDYQWTELRLRWQHEKRIVTIASHDGEPSGSSECDRWFQVTVTPPPDRPLDGEMEVPRLPRGKIRMLVDR